MRNDHALFALLLPCCVVAQPQLPGFFTQDTVTVPCPYDPGTSIRTFDGWEAYQTTDDRWNGPRDSTRCIDLFRMVGQWPYPSILVDQIDGSRPVFIRALYDEQNVLPLTTNNEYSFGFSAYSSGFATEVCPGGPCTGLYAEVRVPDITGTSTVLRQYDAAIDPDSFQQYQLQLCVPTEKFEQNDLREFVVSMKLLDPQPGEYIEGFGAEVMDTEMWGTLVRLTTPDMSAYFTGQFHYDLSYYDYLVMHPDTTYPDGDHIGYLDLSPIPNVPTPSNVTLTLNPFTGFNFQPFTQLRGGLVQGSDSIRHDFTVVNNGADLCMGWQIVEVFWPPGSEYVHQSGHIEFKGSRSCFMFQPGSTLSVAPHGTFHYGSGGRGMLLLQSGSRVSIGNDAELVMHGTLVIKEAPGITVPQDMPLTLGPGARLTFAPGSRIHNANSIGGAMRLVITLDGGQVDLSGLSAIDQAKVHVITLPQEDLSDIRVLGNPVTDVLTLDLASRSSGTMMLRCIDGLGRLVLERTEGVAPGRNTLVIPTYGMRSGTYVMEARIAGERRIARFVKE